MTIKEELKKVKHDREYDTEWLAKYKRIVDGLQAIAEIQADACNNDIYEWTTMFGGLNTLSKLMQEDIDGRKEYESNTNNS